MSHFLVAKKSHLSIAGAKDKDQNLPEIRLPRQRSSRWVSQFSHMSQELKPCQNSRKTCLWMTSNSTMIWTSYLEETKLVTKLNTQLSEKKFLSKLNWKKDKMVLTQEQIVPPITPRFVNSFICKKNLLLKKNIKLQKPLMSKRQCSTMSRDILEGLISPLKKGQQKLSTKDIHPLLGTSLVQTQETGKMANKVMSAQ